MNGNFFISFVVVTALAGCATSDNPREGGLFGGITGVNSGAYDARIRQRQNELGQIQYVQQGLRQKSVALEDEAKQQASELAKEQRRMADMEKNLAALQTNLGKLKAKSVQQEKEITSLQLKIENTRQQLKSEQLALDKLDWNGGKIADPDRYRLMEKERDRLATEYQALTEYSKALLDATR
jgi:capsule polysaccharide export protein KpsE/RkpR